MKRANIYFVLTILFLLSSCESEQEKTARLQREEKQRIEIAGKQKEQARIKAEQEEKERIAREAVLEKERIEKEIYDKYINNSLPNGSTPYSYCYGTNRTCSDWGCSKITVKTPYNSDVLVTLKKGGNVVRHAYIKASSSYTFELPDGIYQPFFYYGKGWNPNKLMKSTSSCDLKGGFISNEEFGKDDPQSLNNAILEYELILQQNGNFSTRPSSSAEAL